MRLALPLVLCAGALVATGNAARADGPPRADAHLEYRAASGCPSEIEFTSEVALRLQYTPWRREASQRITVTIAHTELGFVAVLGANESVRTVTADLCDVLVDNLASAVAEIIDPGSLAPFAPLPAVEVAEAPAPSVVTFAPPAEALPTPATRWRRKTPWKIAGAGVLGVGLGAVAYVAAQRDVHLFNAAIEANCASGAACPADELAEAPWYQAARAAERRAEVEHGLAVGLFVAGGAAVVTGLVMAAINGPRWPERARVVVTPTSGGTAVAVAGGF
jgi:hypothetical protein